uniref:Gustatory receptor n=1 Tax=Histia rhodope TaxID=1453155 RepID=A0A7G4KBX0_9NEOP|nr:odorant receptor [Histia rhodope]
MTGAKNVKNRVEAWNVNKRQNRINCANANPVHSEATFQEALRATLIIGQIFSLIPVDRVSSKNTANVKFSWTSWKCFYLVLSLGGQVFMTAMCLNKLFDRDTSLKATTSVIFYTMTTVTMLMFFQIARNWPCLVQQIANTEQMDPNFDRNLTFKCNITCAIVLTLALTEHILSLLSAFAGALTCYPNMSLYEGFVKYFYPWVFNFLPYTVPLGILTQFFHFQSTFIWNFSDLFVINMSYYLTSRLQQINNKLLSVQGKYLPESFWRVTREDYSRATQLVRRVDDVISGIVFISFANNLFFICLQLFNTLEDGIQRTEACRRRLGRTGPLGGHEAETYFLFSLGYLIARSVAVSLIASQINMAASVPAPVLYDVPSPVYCIEVQRFVDQVNGGSVALSGLQFFNVTRGLLLSVAGTIVTYELVMFQFNSSGNSNSTEVAANATIS